MGVQLTGLNVHDAPAGKPVQLKLTVCAVPEVRDVVTVVLAEPPLGIPLVPTILSESEKLNGSVVVVVVVATTAFSRLTFMLCKYTVPFFIHMLPPKLPSNASLMS